MATVVILQNRKLDSLADSHHPTLSTVLNKTANIIKLECGPMPNVMAALPNIGGALWPTPQSLADAQ